jgi:ankyrin repeat protein
VDETNHYGARALWWPCYYGYHEAAKVLLLVGGADPCHLDGMGRSPLDVAAMKGHHKCVRLLQVRQETRKRGEGA